MYLWSIKQATEYIGVETWHTMGSKSPRTLIRQSLLSTRGHRWRHRNKNQTSKHAQKVVNDTALKRIKNKVTGAWRAWDEGQGRVWGGSLEWTSLIRWYLSLDLNGIPEPLGDNLDERRVQVLTRVGHDIEPKELGVMNKRESDYLWKKDEWLAEGSGRRRKEQRKGRREKHLAQYKIIYSLKCLLDVFICPEKCMGLRAQ